MPRRASLLFRDLPVSSSQKVLPERDRPRMGGVLRPPDGTAGFSGRPLLQERLRLLHHQHRMLRGDAGPPQHRGRPGLSRPALFHRDGRLPLRLHGSFPYAGPLSPGPLRDQEGGRPERRHPHLKPEPLLRDAQCLPLQGDLRPPGPEGPGHPLLLPRGEVRGLRPQHPPEPGQETRGVPVAHPGVARRKERASEEERP